MGLEDTSLKLPQVISVQADAAGRRIALDYGFWGGRLLMVLRRDGRMFRPMAWNSSSSSSLALRQAPGARFVARAVVVGAWRDRQGQAYSFSADGHGHFPGHDFRYALALEQGGRGFD